jgi:hypothetical protein
MRTLLAAIAVLLLFRLAVAGTVQQRLANDRTFKLYVATFKITQAPDGSVTDVQLAPAVDVRWQHEHPRAPVRPVQVSIPRTYIAAAVKKIRAKRWSLFKHSGKPENFYTYFYYSPQLGDRVIEDVHEPE